ncbi:MAG: methylmalonyl Co-A mutase-associated GTPase MeaB [Flavobacteriales bacterium]|jgi:LAO/AO transport system kinase|nr:methylmalonyl Co-A mutase-associated GTPase MeaB [Flavobacteriales bacterium]
MDLYSEIIKGNINALSKAITLVESTLETDQEKSQELISKCINKEYNSVRIGVTGIPGVGKSSFIEKFGEKFIKENKKVAVLAIDPSSEKTRGSILGDKSRMQSLSNNHNVFIRPSSNSGTLGGVSNKTKDSIILCETAGFEIIIIETVGVGQSETLVSKLVDIMLLLSITGAGDRLQGIKRGIIELSHLIIITKDDGENRNRVKETILDFKSTLALNTNIDNQWIQKALSCSAQENTGILEIHKNIDKYIRQSKSTNFFNIKREEQNIFWIHKILREEIGNRKFNNLRENNLIVKIENKIIKNNINIYKIIRDI